MKQTQWKPITLSKAWEMTGKAGEDEIGYYLFDSVHILHKRYTGFKQPFDLLSFVDNQVLYPPSYNGTTPDYVLKGNESIILVIKYPLQEGCDVEAVKSCLARDITELVVETDLNKRSLLSKAALVVLVNPTDKPDEGMTIDVICPFEQVHPGLPIYVKDYIKTDKIYGPDSIKYALSVEIPENGYCYIDGDISYLYEIKAVDEAGLLLLGARQEYAFDLELDWKEIKELEIVMGER